MSDFVHDLNLLRLIAGGKLIGYDEEELASRTADEIERLTTSLDRATSLLVTFCSGLEADKIPLPPELLDWWIDYKKNSKPRIALVN